MRPKASDPGGIGVETLRELKEAVETAASAPAYAGHADTLHRIEDWQAFRALPCSTKQAFRADFRRFLTGRPPVRLHSTSGSTGQPAFVVYSAEEIEAITERAAMTMSLAGVRRGQTVLNLFGYGTFIAGNLYDWGATRLGALVIPFGSPSMTPPAFAAHAVRSMAPGVVNGVPSYLGRFLGDQRRAGCPNLDAIRIVQCAGEILTAGLRARLREVVPPEAEIFDQYGMTEFGPLAAECGAHAGMHLLERGLVCEVLDADGLPVEEGEGELVVTSLCNRAMAFLRYRTGDRVEVVNQPCPCGRPGRRVRVLRRTDDLTKVRGVLCSKQEIVDAVRSVEGVCEFRVVLYRDEDRVDRIAVQVTPEPDAAGTVLVARVQARLKELARIGVDRVDVLETMQIAKTMSGKPRLILDERDAEEPRRLAS